MSNVSGIQANQISSNLVASSNKNVQNNSNFSSYLKVTKSLNDIFDEAGKKYNVSADLLKAIGKAESDFRVDVVSKSGAQGIMQLMPATAASLGVTDAFDAEQNIMGGAKYISQLLDKYDGNTKLALAAYNAGMNNVKKYGGIPPFKETQNYVVKVMKYVEEGVDAGNKSVTTSVAKNTVSAADRIMPIVKSATITPVAQTTFYHSIAQLNHYMSQNVEQDVEQNLDSVFSYDEYMKFLELLIDNYEKSKDKDEKRYF